MALRLDLKDKRLINELDLDSRQSASQLAKKIGISKQGCTLKINNLLKKGVITSCLAILNTPAMGQLSFRMYFKLIDITPEKEIEFRDYLVDHEYVPWVIGCEGMWDYIIVVFPKDFLSFENFNIELNNRYGTYIEKKDIALITRSFHFRSGYLLGEKPELSPLIYAGQPSETVSLDELDNDILAVLAADARAPIVELARKLKVHSKTVAYRIDKLLKQFIIEGFTITVDFEKIGFERYKVFIRTKNMTEQMENNFIEYARMHPYVLYYTKSIGVNDIELELIVKDSTHLREVIADIRKSFGVVIKSYETLKIYKEYKLNFIPWRKL